MGHFLPPLFLGALGRYVMAALCLTATAYCWFAIYAARDLFARAPKKHDIPFHPPVSILKPIRGLDPDAYANFASFCRQTYPRYQLIFGADRADDPGIAVARQVTRDFPHVDISIVINGASGSANPKVATLAAMVPEARYPLLLLSDSDIRVGPGHLESIVQPMADARVGVVTCLYRSEARGFAGVMDALGLSTDFQPAVLVARLVEGMSFAMGSGILIRREVLRTIGELDAIAGYLVDDYLLGNLPTRAGYRVELVAEVVEHTLGTASLRGLIEHQTRWNRGIRASRPWGYAGLLFTQATLPSLLLLLLAADWPLAWPIAALTLGSRLAMAWFVAVHCLGDRVSRRSLWLVPLRDLLSFLLWLGAFFGDTIVWRGNHYRLGVGGRLISETETESAPVGEPAAAARTHTAS